jgi:23S rRNA (uracil1939-C5)-methyltransferase
VSTAVGAELDLVIEKLAAGGSGIARAPGGLVVFVERAAPGDRVRARIVESRGSYARAEIAELLASGPDRREPPCALFGSCGGCAWLHLSDAAQLHACAQILRDALARIGKFTALPAIETLASPRRLAYRARARVVREHGRTGFRARRSHDVVDVERCAVLDPAAQQQLAALRAAAAPAGDVEIRGFGESVLGLQVSPDAFFQANAALWADWQALVADACGRGAFAVELYAGVGFYTVRLLQAFARVIAVERGVSVRDLRRNAHGADVREESAERFARRSLPGLAPDVVLLNPPRGGATADVRTGVAAAAPARIVYVSCDPATQARDLREWSTDYTIERIVLIDAMPQTAHVEALVSLRKLTATGSGS